MKRGLAAALALVAAGCAPALREPPPIETLTGRPPASAETADAPALLAKADGLWARRPIVAAVRSAEGLYLDAAAGDGGAAALIGATRAKVWLADHEADRKAREALAVSAVHTAQWCGRLAPDDPRCDYWLAIAVGIQAREVRQTAEDGLKTMVAALERAIERDPSYDHAGPERVLALVRLRAPGWPLGPGDPESGLDEARKAIARDPDYPPNVLALAEALAATKHKDESREAYGKALALAKSAEAAGDPDAASWVEEARRALGL